MITEALPREDSPLLTHVTTWHFILPQVIAYGNWELGIGNWGLTKGLSLLNSYVHLCLEKYVRSRKIQASTTIKSHLQHNIAILTKIRFMELK